MGYNKYNARKVRLDGYTFDSQKEADYYAELKIRKMAGRIKNFMVKPVIELQPSFKMAGKTIRRILIEPDFLIKHNDLTSEFVDTKGVWTGLSRLKWKWLQYKYKDKEGYKFSII